ncbi:protein D3-like [Ochlerotatus camptorhynchus]|uniref:protein D3-like n=1 Tax=Ochlerotatus camptorhynchus TaxID=644619 RepID=UPI0031D6C4E4
MKRTLCLALTATVILFCQAQQENVPEAFTENEIVPDVVPVAPPALVKVSYPSSGKQVSLGNELTPTQVKDQPTVSWDAEPGAMYTLIMTDPDAPSRANPKMREWKHWVVINVPGSDVASGETVAEYVSSAPPQKSGLHRYIFLVYKQSGKVQFDEPKLSNRNPNRGKFRAAEFAEKYQLGSPIAGNFYQAQYDDYVPQVYASLTETK